MRALGLPIRVSFGVLALAIASCGTNGTSRNVDPARVESRPTASTTSAVNTTRDAVHAGRTFDLAARPGFVRTGETVVSAARGFTTSVDRHTGRIEFAPPRTSSAHRVSVATSSVAMGASEPSREVVSADVENGRAVLRREGSIEQLEALDDSIEQSWRFDSMPSPRGDLRIRVRIDGLAWRATDDDGVHFGDAVTGTALRYGHGEWVDARGERTRIEARYDGAEIELRVDESVLARTAFPATLDPTVSPEFPLDSRAALEPAPNAGFIPQVASNGSDFLVAWIELRGIQRVFAARVRGSDGAILDPLAIAVQPGSTLDARSVDVAFDGTNYFIVWSESTTGVSDVRGVRLRPSDGVVLDSTPIDLAPARSTESGPQVACDPVDCVVAWIDSRLTGGGVVATRVRTSDATVLDPGGTLIGSPTNGGVATLAYDGMNYLMAWPIGTTSNHDLVAARVRASDLFVIDPVPFTISAGPRDESQQALAFDGTNYFAMWIDDRAMHQDLYAARIRPADGVVLDPSGLPIVSSVRPQMSPIVIPTSGDLEAFWVSNTGLLSGYDLQTASLRGSDGTITAGPTPFFPDPGNQSGPGVAFGGGNLLYAWVDPNAPAGILAARVRASDHTVLDTTPLRLSMIANQERSPAVAFDGTYFFAVWVDDRPAPGLYGVRIRPDGTLVDTTAFAIPGGGGTQLMPSVAAGGGNFFVVWEDRRGATSDLWASRIRSSDGTVLDPGGTNVTLGSGNETRPAVAFDGTNFYVVWNDSRGPVFGTRVAAIDGTPQTPLGTILSSIAGVAPGVGCSSTECVVGWSQGSPLKVVAIRVRTSDNAVLDTTPIALDSVNSVYPAIASDGTDFMIAWDTVGGLAARLMRGDGTMPYAQLSVVGATNNYTSVITYDGNYWVDGWVANSTTNPSTSVRRIVHAGNAFQDAAPIVVSPDTNASSRLGLASTNGGRSLLVYDRTDYLGDGGVRVRGRFFYTLAPNGTPCDSPSQCEGNICVDGVCCATACGGGSTTDCQACSIARGGRTDGTCTIAVAGGTCRASTGGCDVAEVCDGSSSACPTDRFAGVVVCRPALSPCDRPEVCSGTSAVCPGDSFAPAGTLCRSAASVCDAPEQCTGTSGACPPDGAAPAGMTCRASTGPCDLAESCDGANPLCPPDLGAAAGTPCRASRGVCDVAESCDGTSTVCPPDAVIAAGAIECRPAAGACDLADRCDGVAADCPPDHFLPSTTPCRDAAGPCDIPEACNGTSAACPSDVFVARGAIQCRAAATICDAPERCDGMQAACPMDLAAPLGTLCRPSTSPCDIADRCDGTTMNCPADTVVTDGVYCDDGSSCNGRETCVAGTCQPGTARNCGDDLECTFDSCDDVRGCLHEPILGCHEPGDPIVDAGSEDAATDAPDAADAEAGSESDVATDTVVDAIEDTGVDAGVEDIVPVDASSDVVDADAAPVDVAEDAPIAPHDVASDAAPDAGTGTARGCGCRVPRGSDPRSSGFAIVALALVFASRRRRASRTTRADTHSARVPRVARNLAAILALAFAAACGMPPTPGRDGAVDVADATDAADATRLDVLDTPDVRVEDAIDAPDAIDVADAGPVDTGVDASVDTGPLANLFDPCRDDTDCNGLGICDTAYPGGLCTRTCTTDSQCSASGRCNAGRCIPSCTSGDLVCDRWGAACAALDTSRRGCLPSCFVSSPPGTAPLCDARVLCDRATGRCGDHAVGTSGDGEPCALDANCMSGHCLLESAGTGFVQGMCIGYGRQPDYTASSAFVRANCPFGTVAVPIGASGAEGDRAECLPECNIDADCRAGYACRHDSMTNGYCYPYDCAASGASACPASYQCNAVTVDGAATHRCTRCLSSCIGRTCGDDGCGGSCGLCAIGESCDASGHCRCTSDCTGRSCGNDGCGGSCGTCATGTTCDAFGRCICVPSCAGRTCGDDGCGGSCGLCNGADVCSAGSCVACSPSCSGRTCGPDGCGGSCGSCAAGQACDASGTCTCTRSCSGRTCGPDGCGGSCGACPTGQSCDGLGACVCIPNCTTTTCGSDGCGGSCGTCPAGTICTSGNCVACTRNCTGRTCGSDGCGGSCGTCTSPATCSSSGTCVTPPCNPVTQTGCPLGRRCVWTGTTTACVAVGTTPRGSECFSETCTTGNQCVQTGADSECRKFCASDSDCGGGRCVYDINGSPYHVCSTPCDPVGSSTGCVLTLACHVTNVGTAIEVTDCGGYGITGSGAPCTDPTDCADRTTCTGTCGTICRVGTTCPRGPCRTVSGWTLYGVCP